MAPRGTMEGWTDVGETSQHGLMVTGYLLPAVPPQKAGGSKDQPKAVSLSLDTEGKALLLPLTMCRIPTTLITSALTFTLSPFPQPSVPRKLHELSHHPSGHDPSHSLPPPPGNASSTFFNNSPCPQILIKPTFLL